MKPKQILDSIVEKLDSDEGQKDLADNCGACVDCVMKISDFLVEWIGDAKRFKRKRWMYPPFKSSGDKDRAGFIKKAKDYYYRRKGCIDNEQR